jgi:hypothetical protein
VDQGEDKAEGFQLVHGHTGMEVGAGAERDGDVNQINRLTGSLNRRTK